MKIPFPEDGRTEFKQAWSPTAKKTIIAFANGSGGIVYFGVADDGEVVGCDHDSVERAIMAFARSGVEPPMHRLIRVEQLKIDNKPVTVAYILPGTQVPYSFKGKVFDQDGVFIRIGGQTVAAKLDEVFELIRRGDRRNWEARPASNQSLTFTSATQIIEREHLRCDQNNWLGYGLLDENRVFTNLAHLLSDQNPTVIRLNFFRADGTFEHSETESGSVLRQMINLRRKLNDINPAFIDKNTSSQTRSEKHPWPPVALREALTNCIAHRDYDSEIDAAINIFQNNVSFLTPGGLPPKITLEEALLPGWSFCRNQRLAELFNRLGWMEKVGSGFADIFQAYAGFNQQPLVKHVGRSFVIELPRTEINQSTATREDIVLSILSENIKGSSRTELEKRLGLGRTTVLNLLKKMEQLGLIIKQGENRNTRYRLANRES